MLVLQKQKTKLWLGSGIELSDKEVASYELQRRDGIFTRVTFKNQQILRRLGTQIPNLNILGV